VSAGSREFLQMTLEPAARLGDPPAKARAFAIRAIFSFGGLRHPWRARLEDAQTRISGLGKLHREGLE